MRNNKDIAKKRVFLIGNGCIENGSEPLEQALKFSEDYNSNYFLPDATKLGPMHALSCLAAEEREWFARIALVSKGKWIPPKMPDGEDLIIVLLHHLSKAMSFRKIMGKSYNDNYAIKWRKSCHDFLESEGLYSYDSAIITTNWDNTLNGDKQIKNLAYLHGRCTEPQLMIFPTETINELNYQCSVFSESIEPLVDSVKKDLKDEVLKLVYERFDGSKNNYDKLFAYHILAEEWLRQADYLYICGLAFNIYDHELMNTIAFASQNKKWEKISIINRIKKENPEKDKKDKIDRVKAILRLDSEKVEFIDSNSL